MNDETNICQATDEELQKAKELLQSLIQIDTSNPPGNESAVFEKLQWELQMGGITPETVGDSADHPNMVARLSAKPENRTHPPLVLSCHVDTVPVPDAIEWQHPPFSGAEADGCIWGRGAIDMKGFAVMALTAILTLARRRVPINRDVIFVAVSDEEAGCDLGSKWLVENRPDLLGNPEYVLNEVGGFTVHRSGRRFYPVQVAEKGVAWLRITARKPPGHSSMPAPDSSLSQIADVIAKLSRATLPWHVTNEAVTFIEGFSQFESKGAQKVSKLLTSQMVGSSIVKLIPDPAQRASVEAILRNTATPTRVQSGESINMLPYRTSVDVDGRLVPGQTAETLMKEIRKVIGDKKSKKFSIEVLRESPGAVFSADTDLFRAIEKTMGQADPDGIVVPSMIPGFTDSQHYARLGATCYGFYPLKLEKDLNFQAMFHGPNERIPVDGFYWGIQTLLALLGDFLVGE